MGWLKLGRWLALVTALVLFVTGCASAGEGDSVQEKSGEAEQAPEHLLTVWSDYLQVLEKMYSSELWALDYVDTCLESGDWKDLEKARTACIAAAQYIDGLSMTEKDLDTEEYLALANAGVDTSYQSMEFTAVPNTLDIAAQTMGQRFLGDLEGNIFFKSTVDRLKETSSVQREMISYMTQYTCIMTNYLLVSLKDEEVSQNYWSSMQEAYPTLVTGALDWMDEEGDLEKATQECLDEYGKISLKYSNILASAEADLYNLEQIMKKNDKAALIASAQQMTNVPALLPIPSWYTPQSSEYQSFRTAKDGSAAVPAPGEKLPDEPYEVSVRNEGVNVEAVEAYVSSIEKYADSIKREPDSNTWYIAMPDYSIQLDWEEQVVTALFSGQDVTFAPEWYLER